MTYSQKRCFRLNICCLLCLLVMLPLLSQVAQAQGVTKQQLQLLVPGPQDLQGFLRVSPGSDTPSLLNNEDATATPPVSAQPIKDAIFLRNDPAGSTPWFSTFSETVSVGAIKRLFQSADGTFDLDIEVVLCDSPEAAHEQLSHLHWTAGMWKPGHWTGPEMIGDESLALVKNGRTQTLAFCYGSLLAVIEGDRSNRSFMFNRALTIQTIPPAAVEAVAYQILLRASQQAKLISVPAQDTHLAVNGHALPKNALMVAGRVYVPVQEFAKAMGLGSGPPKQAAFVTQPQLQMLTPDERDLQGFIRVLPAGENPPRHGEASSAATIPDEFWLELDHGEAVTAGQITKDQQGDVVSCVRRVIYSADGLYRLEIRTQVGETPQVAQRQMENYLRGASAVFSPGTFSGSAVIGDESWFVPANIYGTTLIFRAGKTFIALNEGISAGSERNEGPHFVFPPGAVEAIAYQCLLKASQHPELTGVSSQTAQLTVNGHALPKGALMVAGRVYVPVQEFAKAMRLAMGRR